MISEKRRVCAWTKWTAGLIQEHDRFFEEAVNGAKSPREPKSEWIDINESVKILGALGTSFRA